MTRRSRKLSFLFLLLGASVTVAPGRAQHLDFGVLEAKPVPPWVQKLTLYEIWLKAFSKEGTLAGATRRLPQVAELGVTAIYLGPIARHSSTPYASPYNIADYSALDPEYGSEQDLRDFIRASHRLGMKVLLDVVYYHTAPDSVLRQHPDSLVKTASGKVARGFWPQPLPDYKNPKVRQLLIDSLVHWVRDFDADGFRCDVGAGVPVSFWEQARLALDRIKPDVLLLSESDRPDDQLRAFDINYNFDGYLVLRSVMLDGEPALRLRTQWEQMRRNLPQGARLLHFDDNHDWRRPVLEFGEKGSLLCSIFDFTLDGIPLIYNGQEVGDPDLTHWTSLAPIHWLDDPKESVNGDHRKQILGDYQKLFAMRREHPEFTEGRLIWVNNSEPESVVSFLRKKDADEVLVVLNFSNRKQHVTVDLPVMDYYAVDNLLRPGKTWFPLYSGRVFMELSAFDYLVGKKIPLAELEQQ